MTLQVILILSLLVTAVLYGRAAGEAWTSRAPKVEKIREYRTQTAELRSRKCLPPIPVLVPSWQVSPRWRDAIVRRWRTRYVRSLHAGYHCPRTPEQIIRAVFPDSTEDAAIRVAYCESRLYPRAKNRTSSASGLFQLLAFHWTPPGPSFDPFDPWANTRYAYGLSDGGRNWSAWVCKP